MTEHRAAHFSRTLRRLDAMLRQAQKSLAAHRAIRESAGRLRHTLGEARGESAALESEMVWLRAHVVVHEPAHAAHIDRMAELIRALAERPHHRRAGLAHMGRALEIEARRLARLETMMLGLKDDLRWLRRNTAPRPRGRSVSTRLRARHVSPPARRSAGSRP